MSYCPKCGAELDEKAKFCPACGTSVSPSAAVISSHTRREQRKPISTLTIVLIVLFALIFIVAILVASVLLGVWQPFGQVVGSGNLVTVERAFSDFTSVEVGSGFNVEVTQSGFYRILLTADDNLLDDDYIDVSKTGDTLAIRLKWGYSYQNVTLKARITMPELYELEFSGGTYGVIKDFSSSHDFVLELSGGSSLTRARFTTSGDTTFSLSGGSHLIELDGGANDLLLSASSGSHLDLSDFSVHDARVNISGGSHAIVNFEGRLDGNLSGGSNLQYIGDPAKEFVSTTGGSTVAQLP
jgi:predicted nucleic acid-binding Zn ribbon protein